MNKYFVFIFLLLLIGLFYLHKREISETFQNCYKCVYDAMYDENDSRSDLLDYSTYNFMLSSDSDSGSGSSSGNILKRVSVKNNTGCYASECDINTFSTLEECYKFCKTEKETNFWTIDDTPIYDELKLDNYYVPAVERKHIYLDSSFPYDNITVDGYDKDGREILDIKNMDADYVPFCSTKDTIQYSPICENNTIYSNNTGTKISESDPIKLAGLDSFLQMINEEINENDLNIEIDTTNFE